MLKIYEKIVIIIIAILFIITFLLIFKEYNTFIANKDKTQNEYSLYLTETPTFEYFTNNDNGAIFGNNCNSSNNINTPEECFQYWSSNKRIPTPIKKGTDNSSYITKIYDNTNTNTEITNAGIYGNYKGSSLNAEIPEASYRTNLPNFTAIYDTMTSCADACSNLLTKSSCELYDGSPNSPIIQCGNSFNPDEKKRLKCQYNAKKEICQYAKY